MDAATKIGTPCKSCGDTRRPDTECSWCGGHGLRTEMWGVAECRHCGGSGVQWPPFCQGCSKYRSMKGWS